MDPRRIRLLSLALCLFPSRAPAQGVAAFDAFLGRYEAAAAEERPELLRAFVERQRGRGGFPIADPDGSVVFLFAAEGEEEVRLAGDFLPRSPSNVYWDTVGEPMSRVGALRFRRRAFEPDARLDYAFVVDGRRVRDPLNPRSLVSGVGGGEVSELVLPGHRLPAEVEARPGVPRGSLRVVEEPWAAPKVTVYLPPGYDPSREYPAVYTADGSAWIELIRLPTILDNLIADGAIEPVIAVMIDAAADRSAWYGYDPRYLAYLRRVVEHVDATYSTLGGAAGRLHAGTSAGGRATAYAGLEMPDVFGKLAMLSPSFAYPVDYLGPFFGGRRRPDPGLRVWMSAGSYEGSLHRDARTLEAYLRSAGVPVRAVHPHQGHSFGAWREGAVAMLRHFFPTRR